MGLLTKIKEAVGGESRKDRKRREAYEKSKRDRDERNKKHRDNKRRKEAEEIARKTEQRRLKALGLGGLSRRIDRTPRDHNPTTYGANFKPDQKVLAQREAERKRKEAERERKRAEARANSNFPSSAGWEKNDTQRANANPMKGTHTKWKDSQKPMTKAAEEYLRQRSMEMGDTEFVGGLIDALTSNRYFPGQGGNKGMDALAGEATGLGPDIVGGKDYDAIRMMTNNRWPHSQATRYADVDPDWRGSISADDLLYGGSGGDYLGPTSNRDPAFGLIKLGLYGSGLGDTGNNVTDSIIDNWVGGIKTQPGMLDDERMYGVYKPRDNTVTIDPEVRSVDHVTNHELMHRGLSALGREYRAYGQEPRGVWDWLPGGFNTGQYLATNPDTGRGVTMHQYLVDRAIGESDNKSSGSKGHSLEHNMINAASRNRAARSAFLGVNPADFGSITRQNNQRRNSMGGLNKLGMLGHAIVDANQAQKREYIDDRRKRFDNASIYGGKSGTKLHPLLQGFVSSHDWHKQQEEER